MKKSTSLSSIIIQRFLLKFCIETINKVPLRNEEENHISEISKEELSFASKFELVISLLNTLYSLHISQKQKIVDFILENKDSIIQALSKGLESSFLLNKLKGAKLFRVLCQNEFFTLDEMKGILSFIRQEYRKQKGNLEFVRDLLLEILEISKKFPYQVHEVFKNDVEVQYNDFASLRTDTSTEQDLCAAQSSLGNTVEMFFAELEIF
mmetsp:Transcript_21089/g.20780  ORF Transcript_21089/g.20780 Transcript_21089/m.20780 type:complete len:209 (+) Transcript_21089:511-1137(+)|eukprot:CAMPEP_0197017708 /NCGR_PEP_ID=MMETSP1380-20130617/79692_1 /TAXON_ID=5936 /ORGANISM="Euplotes crassus, Strain CT5" /LENGTH=208 /DNA_ID=CAMNT_0042444839 /DNA_START=472 /DNA_END=1098 /DNA_ORIENTATION=-